MTRLTIRLDVDRFAELGQSVQGVQQPVIRQARADEQERVSGMADFARDPEAVAGRDRVHGVAPHLLLETHDELVDQPGGRRFAMIDRLCGLQVEPRASRLPDQRVDLGGGGGQPGNRGIVRRRAQRRRHERGAPAERA